MKKEEVTREEEDNFVLFINQFVIDKENICKELLPTDGAFIHGLGGEKRQ